MGSDIPVSMWRIIDLAQEIGPMPLVIDYDFSLSNATYNAVLSLLR